VTNRGALLTEGLAKSTRARYEAAQQRFWNFCAQCGIQPSPITEWKLQLFIAGRAGRVAANSIRQDVSAINSWKIDHDEPPISLSPTSARILAGAAVGPAADAQAHADATGTAPPTMRRRHSGGRHTSLCLFILLLRPVQTRRADGTRSQSARTKPSPAERRCYPTVGRLGTATVIQDFPAHQFGSTLDGRAARHARWPHS